MVEYMEGAPRRRGDSVGEGARPRGGRSARLRAEADMAHACERMSVDPRFVKLRRRFALQAGALVGAFLFSYTAYLLLSAYARDFMSVQIVDSVNVALVLGVGQFLLTFVLAWAFGRFSTLSIDPLAEEIRDRARDEETISGRVIG
ncbi:DUF485 domain-containing protein [Nocardiopsis terrae]|uniref:DUF485 domain-containing protein n=1 Tax=Nocardiopsis terrae TaxID=372655 RepID=UPI001E3F74F2|nr:DUF485 domain-containing protein [Nocardiopsis terrae]